MYEEEEEEEDCVLRGEKDTPAMLGKFVSVFPAVTTFSGLLNE